MASVPESVHAGELLRYPGPWAFDLPRAHVIIVSDEQLEELLDPDRPVDLSMTHTKSILSLRQVCEDAQRRGARTLIFSIDHFFSQYRPGLGGKPRKLLPDTDEYIERIARIGAFAEGYGLGLELSLVSPLELGAGFRRATGEAGRWVHYREGIRNPETGKYTVSLWRHRTWANNKGAFALESAGVRVFAFREWTIRGTHLFAVDREGIREITETARIDDEGGPVHVAGNFRAERVAISGEGASGNGLDRVLVVLAYTSPEMDYFSEKARPFIDGLLARYHAAGVKLNGLYADEMHIQQDWDYFGHHEHGQFALRYLSDGYMRRFAATYGTEYADLDPYMVYMCSGQHDFLPTIAATDPAQHVLGPEPADAYRTFLFRARYYRMLEGGVIDLMAGAKHRAEELAGHTLESRAHATWAESPTIDWWDFGPLERYAQAYEYTAAFRWSNTVHQAASACQDYFRWNDFLTGGGNDHAEGGYADRDYFALALACSTGVLNDVPYAYAAHWGMTPEIAERRHALVDAYGAVASAPFKAVEDSAHRAVDVLMLYPIDLVAADERFGSWMAQYGYANYITAEKLLAEGRVTDDGAIVIRDRRYTTLVALFEPFPSEKLLAMFDRLAETGGRAIWSGPPPFLTDEGGDAREKWSAIFGARIATSTPVLGLPLPGRTVTFSGPLGLVPPQAILTDYPIDAVWPLDPLDATPAAHVVGYTAATVRRRETGGCAVALGFRPRDDQSRSLGEDIRTWFAILDALRAYPPSGRFPGEQDNTEYVSRTTPWLACRFPNGTTALAVHFREYEEGWPGGFGREPDRDREWMAAHPLPSDRISVRDLAVNGHRLTYDGRLAVAFRTDAAGDLIAFAGHGCMGIEVDGRAWRFAEEPVATIAWAPVPEEQRADPRVLVRIMVDGAGPVRIPVPKGAPDLALVAAGPTPGSRGAEVPSQREGDALVVDVPEPARGRWIFAIEG